MCSDCSASDAALPTFSTYFGNIIQHNTQTPFFDLRRLIVQSKRQTSRAVASTFVRERYQLVERFLSSRACGIRASTRHDTICLHEIEVIECGLKCMRPAVLRRCRSSDSKTSACKKSKHNWEGTAYCHRFRFVRMHSSFL